MRLLFLLSLFCFSFLVLIVLSVTTYACFLDARMLGRLELEVFLVEMFGSSCLRIYNMIELWRWSAPGLEEPRT
ncbi:hypothetical protein L873DRAFT_1809066 [Choiromyces venosus 120613-1]|uniref:Uncharacterized protein n=1 Tax=Choiromyces venosus 120613-1 TaxID=1336337 RepID=A0A3N4JI48_9PEZI|nr:hypothetical protein L873DRAFT_1809066 [Choiromyces venosus 120613-1]